MQEKVEGNEDCEEEEEEDRQRLTLDLNRLRL